MNSPKVVVEGLCKVFGTSPKQAIDMLAGGATKEEVFARTGQIVGVHNVSFEVKEGEIFVLMGLSGSGKSTLIRLINRLVEPTAGKVLIDGRDVAAVPRSELTALRRKDMSMVFQSFALMPQRTVLSNAAFGLEVAGVGRKERERRAMTVLEQVGLAPFAQKLPAQLSGGMQQRVGLARALAVNPSLMIMDEAFSALDPLKRKEMQNVLLESAARAAAHDPFRVARSRKKRCASARASRSWKAAAWCRSARRSKSSRIPPTTTCRRSSKASTRAAI